MISDERHSALCRLCLLSSADIDLLSSELWMAALCSGGYMRDAWLFASQRCRERCFVTVTDAFLVFEENREKMD